MVEVLATARRWGNSIGVIIPKDIAEKQGIEEGEEVILEIKRKRLAKEFFGMLSGWKKSPQQLKDEARAGWE